MAVPSLSRVYSVTVTHTSEMKKNRQVHHSESSCWLCGLSDDVWNDSHQLESAHGSRLRKLSVETWNLPSCSAACQMTAWWERKLNLRTRTSNLGYNYPWVTGKPSSRLFLSRVTAEFTSEWCDRVSQCGFLRTWDKNLSCLARMCLHCYYPRHRSCELFGI